MYGEGVVDVCAVEAGGSSAVVEAGS